jgi:ABC-2 type transport system permease protein
MKRIKSALWVEVLKVRRTKIFPVSIYFFIFIGIMMGLLMFLSMHPEIASRSSVMKTKTLFLGGPDWSTYYELLLQIILTVGVIGAGIVTSWVFGREFSDRVVKDLLALPVPRSTIVLSKLTVLFIWTLILSVTVLVAAMLTGLAIRLPGWNEAAFLPFLSDYMACAVLNALLITPVAFVASAGRGYILPISFVILIMILSQLLFVGVPGLTPWFPWALPALYSGVGGIALPSPGMISYLLYILTVLAGGVGTMAWWRYADHK